MSIRKICKGPGQTPDTTCADPSGRSWRWLAEQPVNVWSANDLDRRTVASIYPSILGGWGAEFKGHAGPGLEGLGLLEVGWSKFQMVGMVNRLLTQAGWTIEERDPTEDLPDPGQPLEEWDAPGGTASRLVDALDLITVLSDSLNAAHGQWQQIQAECHAVTLERDDLQQRLEDLEEHSRAVLGYSRAQGTHMEWIQKQRRLAIDLKADQ